MKCPHGWTVEPPDFRCPQATCPTNAKVDPEPVEVKYAHVIRWRDQHVRGALWSDWHIFVLVQGSTRGTRCALRVDVGPFSVERAAIPIDEPREGCCAECFA